MPHAEVTLPGTTASVGAARRFLSATLAQWDADDAAWTAAQVVSELATNAVIHAGTAFTLRLELTATGLRVEVGDGSRRTPRQRHYGLSATTGRGLALVASLADDWGVEVVRGGEGGAGGAGGKVVWCVLPLHADDAGAGDGLAAFLTGDELAMLGIAPG